MTFKLFIGKRCHGRAKSHARCIRILLEEYERFVEIGTAYIERNDGVVVARFDLDIHIPANR